MFALAPTWIVSCNTSSPKQDPYLSGRGDFAYLKHRCGKKRKIHNKLEIIGERYSTGSLGLLTKHGKQATSLRIYSSGACKSWCHCLHGRFNVFLRTKPEIFTGKSQYTTDNINPYEGGHLGQQNINNENNKAFEFCSSVNLAGEVQCLSFSPIPLNNSGTVLMTEMAG